MKHTSLGLRLSLVLVGACQPVVLDVIPGDSSGAGDASAASASATAGSGTLPSGGQALAFRGAEAPFSEAPQGDDESLVLHLASGGLTCDVPDISGDCDGSSQWQLTLNIPPELNRVGLIYLNDPRIGFYEAINLPDCGGGWGYGNGFWGTLEIIDMDPTSVSVRLTGVDASSDLSFDGDYVAERCGTVPVTPPPTPAVAVLGSSIIGNPSSGTGPAADPGALYLYAGSTPGSCEEPAPIVDCATERQMVLSLPPELQAVGTVALDAIAIDAIYSGPGTSCGPATFATGSLEITNIDESTVDFRLLGTGYAGFDGLYSATRCP